jgi:2-polyprenyl-3-methyl-5-hydroxy-6-metoxy-1,4-benzoquinol methylase
MVTDGAAAIAPSWPAQGLEHVGRCPVCNDRQRSVAYEGLRDSVFFCAPGQWTLYRCTTCGSYYLDPRPTADTISLAYSTYFTHHTTSRPELPAMSLLRLFQRSLANGYRNWRYGTRDDPSTRFGVLVAMALPRQRALMDSELRHLPRPPAGATVLDIGCGDGAFLEWAKAAGWNTLGVDFDPAAVASARMRGLDVRCGSVDVLADSGLSFDAITLSHVIEHVHDPADLLRRIRTLLKPGGLFWVDTPNVDSIGHRVFGRAWIGLDPPRHLVLFNPSSLQALLASVDLNVIRTLSRFEACDRVFAASDRIARNQDPIADQPVPRGVRLRGRLASWRERVSPATSEFITILATREK